MELEEPEDDEWEWNTPTTTSKYYLSQPYGNSSDGKVSCVFKRGINLGKKILVAGLVASSAPLVVPPLVVASAIGIAVSVPYAFFLASHACTENLMRKLLPLPTTTPHHYPPPQILDEEEEACFHIDKDEQFLVDETNEEIEMVGVQHMNDDEVKDVTSSDSDYGQQVVKEEDQLGVSHSHSQDGADHVQHSGSKEDECESFYEDEEGNAAPEMHDDDVTIGDEIDSGIMEGLGVVITIEGLEEDDNDDVEEFKAPFEVTTSVEEFGDEAIEGDIDEDELQRETRGLLEKIRDEGRNIDSGGECVDAIHGETNKSDHDEIGPVVENLEVANEDNAREEEDATIVSKEKLESINAENNDAIYNEVESAEPVTGVLEEKDIDNRHDLPKQMGEHSEMLDGGGFEYGTSPAETVGGLVIEYQEYNVLVSEDSSGVTSEKNYADMIVKEEPKPVLDGPTVLQGGKLDDCISDSVNQKSRLDQHNEMMDLSDADGIKTADEWGFNLSDEKRLDPDAGAYAYAIDLQEESSNVMVDGHTAPREVPISSEEQELRPSECSSRNDMMCTPPEAVFDEERIWKQIHIIRKIIGYEPTTQASCADELKALYIFTGVEPPTLLNENSYDPAEINEKLHFLMSILGIKC